MKHEEVMKISTGTDAEYMRTYTGAGSDGRDLEEGLLG